MHSLLNLKKSSPDDSIFRSSFSACARLAFGVLALSLGCGGVSLADDPPPDYPVFVSTLSNPNDYVLFANSGWDGNWYVGSNTLWIKKLPPIPTGRYTRAYLGARLGRAKILESNAKPWDKVAVPGSLFMAISSTMAWTSEQTKLLTTTTDIPHEGAAEEAIEGTGESEWFWIEIPIRDLDSVDHFVALWSSSPDLVNVSSSPVLAAGWGGKDVSSWLSHDIHGALPQKTLPVVNGISYFQPAMALKLIPEGPTHPIQIKIVSWTPGTTDHPRPVLTAEIEGDSIESAWIEYARPASSQWTRIGLRQWQAPYIFTVDQSALPKGRVQLRVAATNIWEKVSASSAFSVDVSALTPSANKKN